MILNQALSAKFKDAGDVAPASSDPCPKCLDFRINRIENEDFSAL